MTECVLLIHSGDRGHWIWPAFHYWYRKNWQSASVCDTVFLGESFAPDWPGVIPMTTGKVPWGAGLLNALDRLECKYFAYVHEDYFFVEPSRTDKLSRLIDFIKEKDIMLMKSSGWDAGFNDASRPMVPTEMQMDGETVWLYNNNSGYLISHQTAIWNKEFFKTTLRPSWSGWDHELEGSDELRKRHIPIYAYRGKAPIPYVEVVRQNALREGADKWFKEAEEGSCRI
jgi:hypothetical protein